MMDVVLFWNEVAQEANRLDHTGPAAATNQRGPTRSSRALAMVHLAIHDAYFGSVASPAYAPWHPANLLASSLTTTGVSLAVSAAAHRMLVELYPSQRALFDRALRGVGVVPGVNLVAENFGEQVAANILLARAGDGSATSEVGGINTVAKWAHRPDPCNPNQGLLGPNYGAVQHFVLASVQAQAAPPLPGSAGYAAAFAEVKAKGVVQGGTRTPDETAAGIFWAYDGASQLGTPPRLYNQILVKVANNKGNSVAQNARLFALVNVAMAEAGIDAWYWKYTYDLWRPVVGIREHGDSLGPAGTPGPDVGADSDPFWKPLGAPRTNEVGAHAFTPPFPAYPSGHATFGGAAFETIRLFYGFAPGVMDNLSFDLVSDELNGASLDSDGSVRTRHLRKFDNLVDAMFENGLSRVYLGVHWRFDATTAMNAADLLTSADNVGGIPLGRAIASAVFASPFQKLP